jgi:transcription elongation GreA/GreB family factor
VKRTTLLTHLRTILLERITATEAELASTLVARNSDTKSSAGDKHEVGRAMVQQELDQLDLQLGKTRTLLHELDRIQLDRVHDRVAFGSMVTTDQGTYFISIGMGGVEVAGGTCYVISLASPIGQVLNGKVVGETVVFNGRSLSIMAID